MDRSAAAAARGPLHPQRGEQEEEPLLVFGYSCKLFRDDERALEIDRGSHLIPWMGDEALRIDRYDCRGALHELRCYEPPAGGYDPWQGLTERERKLEQVVDEERYMALYRDEDEERMLEEEEMKRLKSLSSVGASDNYHQTAFNYDSVSGGDNGGDTARQQTDTQQDQQDQDQQQQEEEEPYVPPQCLALSSDMHTPSSRRHADIIERTADFVARKGPQMEILIKARQGDNRMFDFLTFDDHLQPFFRHLVVMIKEGRFTPGLSDSTVASASGETASADMQANRASSLNFSRSDIIDTSRSDQMYRPSANCAYQMLVNNIRSRQILQQEQQQKKEKLQSEDSGDVTPPVSDRTSNDHPSNTNEHQAQSTPITVSPDQQPTDMTEKLTRSRTTSSSSSSSSSSSCSSSSSSTSSSSSPSSNSTASSKSGIGQHQQDRRRRRRRRRSSASSRNHSDHSDHENNNNIRKPKDTQLAENRGPETSRERRRKRRRLQRHAEREKHTAEAASAATHDTGGLAGGVAGGLAGGAAGGVAGGAAGGESHATITSAQRETPADVKMTESVAVVQCDDNGLRAQTSQSTGASYRLPPPDARLIIDKMASYVAKNGRDFEVIVLGRGDERFNFLKQSHQFNEYYCHKLAQYEADLSGRSKNNNNTTSSASSHSATQSLNSTRAVPVSFSIRTRPGDVVSLDRSALPLEESSDTASDSDQSTEQPTQNTTTTTTTTTTTASTNHTSCKYSTTVRAVKQHNTVKSPRLDITSEYGNNAGDYEWHHCSRSPASVSNSANIDGGKNGNDSGGKGGNTGGKVSAAVPSQQQFLLNKKNKKRRLLASDDISASSSARDTTQVTAVAVVDPVTSEDMRCSRDVSPTTPPVFGPVYNPDAVVDKCGADESMTADIQSHLTDAYNVGTDVTDVRCEDVTRPSSHTTRTTTSQEENIEEQVEDDKEDDGGSAEDLDKYKLVDSSNESLKESQDEDDEEQEQMQSHPVVEEDIKREQDDTATVSGEAMTQDSEPCLEDHIKHAGSAKNGSVVADTGHEDVEEDRQEVEQQLDASLSKSQLQDARETGSLQHDVHSKHSRHRHKKHRSTSRSCADVEDGRGHTRGQRSASRDGRSKHKHKRKLKRHTSVSPSRTTSKRNRDKYNEDEANYRRTTRNQHKHSASDGSPRVKASSEHRRNKKKKSKKSKHKKQRSSSVSSNDSRSARHLVGKHRTTALRAPVNPVVSTVFDEEEIIDLTSPVRESAADDVIKETPPVFTVDDNSGVNDRDAGKTGTPVGCEPVKSIDAASIEGATSCTSVVVAAAVGCSTPPTAVETVASSGSWRDSCSPLVSANNVSAAANTGANVMFSMTSPAPPIKLARNSAIVAKMTENLRIRVHQMIDDSWSLAKKN